MDIIYYLLICVSGLSTYGTPDSCEVYELRPQWEMTSEVIAGKIVKICETATQAARDHGGKVTKCEVSDEFPEGYSLAKPVLHNDSDYFTT